MRKTHEKNYYADRHLVSCQPFVALEDTLRYREKSQQKNEQQNGKKYT